MIRVGDLVKLRDDRWQIELMFFDSKFDIIQLIYNYLVVVEEMGEGPQTFEVGLDTPPMLYLGQEEVIVRNENTSLYDFSVRLGSRYWVSKFLHEGKLWYSVARYRDGLEQCFQAVTSSQ